MTKGWLIVNDEFDTPYVDKNSKAFLDTEKAVKALNELNMLPENRDRMHFNCRPDNAYGLHYPYNLKEIELEI
jgi:hypothetical protein